MKYCYYLWTLLLVFLAAATRAPGQAPTAGLVAYYPFDETQGTSVGAAAGQFGAGQTSGGATWLPGGGYDGGGALALTGAAAVTLPVQWQPTAFTVSWWTQPTSLYNYGQQTGGPGWGSFIFHSTGAGQVYVGTDADTRLFLANQEVVQLNRWQHFVFSFDNGTARFYKNGFLIGQRTGMTLPTAWPSFTLTGNQRCDELRIYDRAVTDQEVRALYGRPDNPGVVADSVELRVLRQFYYAAKGDQWSNRTNWPATPAAWQAATLGSAVGWAGLTITDGDVTRIRVSNVNPVAGVLSPKISQLTQLTELRLGGAGFTGPIPATLGQLSQLQALTLFYARFSGLIPPELGQLTNLTYLSLLSNRLSGPIPPELGQLRNLTQLVLSNYYSIARGEGNQFTGGIPKELGQLTKLTSMDLSLNPLGGLIPPELGQLKQLTFLELDDCELTGTIPAQVLQLPLPGTLLLGYLNPNYHKPNHFDGLAGPATVVNPATKALRVAYAELDFADLEPHFTGPGQHPYAAFEYAPQNTPAGTDTAYVVRGATTTLRRPLGGQRTHYQWERLVGQAWVELTGETGETLALAGVQEGHEGSYRTRATNDYVTGLTLTSKPVYVSLLPYDALALNEPAPTPARALQAPVPVGPTPTAEAPINYVRTFVPRVALTDLGAAPAAPAPATPASAAAQAPVGSILREHWTKLRTQRVSELPLSTPPTQSTQLSSFEAPTGLGNDYGARVRGYVLPPLTGAYTFYLASDDQGELYLSPDEDPAHAQRVAYTPVITGPRQWDKYAEQRSGPVQLVAGRRYYIEARHQQVAGADHLAVAWRRPDGVLEGPIPGSALAACPAPPPPAQYNYVVNPGFEDDNSYTTEPFGWRTRFGPGTSTQVHYVSDYNGVAHGGSYYGIYVSRDNYEVYTYQLIGSLPPGRYTARAWLRGNSAEYGPALRVQNYGGPLREARPPVRTVATVNDWQLVELADLQIDGGQCEIGFYANVPGNVIGYFDDVELVRQPDPAPAAPPAPERPVATTWTKEQLQVTTQYLDGLGRPVQTVQHRQSPLGQDVVQPVAYDGLGRQPRQYLPYVAPAPDAASAVVGAYRPAALGEQDQYYRQGRVPGLPQTGVAYAETQFEPSPLHRVLAQGAPGESWDLHAADNHALSFTERPNALALGDSVRRLVPGYGSEREDLVDAGWYADGELWVKTTQDEQRQWARTYADQQGQVVLKQVALQGGATPGQWLSTYYVFDDFGRARATLPPLAVLRLRKNGWQVPGAGVERLLFRTHYDGRGRVTEKQVPDQDGYQYLVYDQLDRPILSQDVAQQARGQWLATKYDALGRVVYSALLTRAGQSREQLQAQADQAGVLFEAPSSTPLAVGGTRQQAVYYSNQAFPGLSGTDQLLTVHYYDSYDFDQNGTPDAAYAPPTEAQLGGVVPGADARVRGLPTRQLVRVPGTPETEPGAWLSTTSFYDEQARPIQVQSRNARGGQDVSTTRYDFAGQALGSYATHRVPGQPALAVQQQQTYDHAGRLLSTTQTLAGEQAQRLASHAYNELGQLRQKVLGASLQTLDYRYNIRGWLTHVNDPDQPDPQDLWSLQLSYDQGFAQNQYTGNLAGQRWRSRADGVERAYGYRYDALSRLLQGDFIARSGTGQTTLAAPWSQERSNYRFWAADYDAAGNLLTLRRRGLVAAATRKSPAQFAETDNLRYRYQPASGSEPSSNRLQRVDDLAPAPTAFGTKLPERPDFSDGPTAGATVPDYSYDAAGSLSSDKNKNITAITYNYQHLPVRLAWANGDVLEYRYAASGQKVAKLATAAGKATVRTDYLGPWQYEADTLRWLTTSEGRALRLYQKDAAGQVTVKTAYEYGIKDHLGNLRVAFRPGERRTYWAGLDSNPDQQRREQHEFDSTSVSAPIRTSVGPQFTHSGDGVARLLAGGNAPQPLGPLKQLAVGQGDTVTVTAYGLYQQPVASTGWAFSLASFVASLVQQQPAAPTPGPDAGAGRRPRVLPLLSLGLGLAPALPAFAAGVPHAYLRLLIFDADSALVDTKTVPLSSAARGSYEQLQARVILPKAGYVQAYVANESETEVFFDDMSVEHRQGLLVQESEYDPYGLELAGLSKASAPQTRNKYTWNGKEQQTEFGLNWHDHGWRFYDPQLGRWVVTDPDMEKGGQESWGTYEFGLDNAVRYNDLDGRMVGPGDPPAGGLSNDFVARAVFGVGISVYNVAAHFVAIAGNSPVRYEKGFKEDANGEAYGVETHVVFRTDLATEAKSLAVNGLVVALSFGGGSGEGMALEQASGKAVAAELKATALPTVKAGSDEWKAAVKQLSSGGKSNVRTATATDAKNFLLNQEVT